VAITFEANNHNLHNGISLESKWSKENGKPRPKNTPKYFPAATASLRFFRVVRRGKTVAAKLN
jgi:hypothetical protein